MCCFAVLAGFPSNHLCILEFEAGAWWGEKEVKEEESNTEKQHKSKPIA